VLTRPSLGQDEIGVADLLSQVLKEQSDRMVGHPVEVDIRGGGDLTIRGDSELLSMAISQFLDNAAKYSFAGRTVKVAAWESHSEVMISVHNYGPAIPISERERVFQRFYRTEESKNMAAAQASACRP
jgi:signal transduction histidine kinase